MKNTIIGHRGAAGLALENSRNALQQAVKLKVDMIEIDVRLTADRQLVVCHDSDLKHMANDERKIEDFAWDDLKDVKLKDGSPLLRLEDALKIIGSTPVIIEAKDTGTEDALLAVLAQFPQAQAAIASFKTPVLTALRERDAKLKLYQLEHTDALQAIHTARRGNFDGVGLNCWLLSPNVYWLARRYQLDIYAYTVNGRFLARFIRLLYPRVKICTDFPDRFLKKRRIRKR